jgi:hypothetical protein
MRIRSTVAISAITALGCAALVAGVLRQRRHGEIIIPLDADRLIAEMQNPYRISRRTRRPVTTETAFGNVTMSPVPEGPHKRIAIAVTAPEGFPFTPRLAELFRNGMNGEYALYIDANPGGGTTIMAVPDFRGGDAPKIADAMNALVFAAQIVADEQSAR